jgi:alpha 1,2-mannosyltransferase
MNPAIVYLAQNTRKDRTYGRDSRALLEKSLDLLFENYNNKFKHSVIIFHEGDFRPKDQQEVAKNRNEIQFREIHFEVPSFLKSESGIDKTLGQYGMGYRHMIRFFALLVFDKLDELGYDWFMRLDDDSFIHSKIDYNLFEFMEKKGYEYGYRVEQCEGKCGMLGFEETVLDYIASERIKPAFFYEHLKRSSIKIILKNGVKTILMKLNPSRSYSLEPLYEYDRWIYYNNFFITKLSFWKRPDVRSFLHHLDRTGGGYKYRWGDACQQSVAVQTFMPKEKVYKFKDWTYEHATLASNGKLLFGGIFEGKSIRRSDYVKEFIRLYGKPHRDMR